MPPRVPVATYRLQLHRELTLRDAAELVGYLSELGVSDLYTSPLTTARPGSEHGYDVVDPRQVNPELGGEEALAELAERLHAAGMGLLVDLVPNHMCIAGGLNPWWNDILENGPSSPYADFFDIDWHPPKKDLHNKVLLPVLGDQYGKVLENGELRLSYDAGAFHLRYYEHTFPVAPRSVMPLLEGVLAALPAGGEAVVELESILTATRHLPPRTERDPDGVRERQREKEVIKRRLAALTAADANVREGLAAELAISNGRPGDPRSFDRLEAVLAEQAYRLCHWRVASDEINYRRFFDINDLAAIRVEDPAVFEATHELAFRLVERGWVTGLRIDHVDGLYDPERYLRELTRRAPVYVVVEKILGPDEQLPRAWPIAGTTGYDFLDDVNCVLVDHQAAPQLRRLHERLTGPCQRPEDLAFHCKKLVLDVAMSGELTVLARMLDRISEQHRSSRDFTLNSLHAALREVIACFPVYRSYLCEHAPVGRDDRERVQVALACAKRHNPAISKSIYDFIRGVLLRDDPPGLGDDQRALRRRFAQRMQQLTSPVTAKGVEDTAFYRQVPLASLAEVGSDLGRLGLPVRDFHRRNLERRERWPHALLATSTHDTKRSEDVRARINVLSEIPAVWHRAVKRWRDLNRAARTSDEAPDASEEYLFYQTLVGAWPLGHVDASERARFIERIEAYMIKALREAKVHTSWIDVNEAHEAAVTSFVRRALTPGDGDRFLRALGKFLGRVAPAGLWNALAQVLLKVASPGVPDFYQGTELWSFTLVDPDNRQPIDWARRRAALAALDETTPARLAARPEDGLIKLLVTRRGLALRRAHPELFSEGGYLPLEISGARAGHVIAFARLHRGRAAVAVTGRLFARLGAAARALAGADVWRDTAVLLPDDVPGGPFRDALTGAEVRGDGRALPLARVFGTLPMALLYS